MAQVYTVTASTSIVLISTLQSPNTIVLLSSISYPGHIVGIRDITGDPSITARPIIVSTTQGVRFYDYSFSTLITQPNGYLSLSSKDPNTWQLLNTQANQNSLSNAYLTDLSSTYAYITLVSSVQEYVSSFTASQVFVTRSIFLEGNTQITGSISVRGNVDIFSTLKVSDDMNISSGLLVGGSVFIPSSLTVRDGLTVDGTLSTLQNLVLTQNLVLGGELKAEGALLDKNLIVQTVDAETLRVGGSARIAGTTRILSTLLTEQLQIQKGGIVETNITVQSNTSMQGNLQVDGDTYVSTLATQSSMAIGGCLETRNLLSIQGSISTIDSIQVAGSTFVSSNTQVQSDLFIFGSFIGSSLTAAGNIDFYNTHVRDSLFLRNNLNLLLTGTVNTENLRILGNLGIGSDLYGDKVIVQGNVSSIGPAFVEGIVSSQGTLETGNSLTVGQNAFVSKAINITKSISTSYLSSGYDLFITQNLFVGGTVSTSNLAAPISLSISTLSLRGALNVQSEGGIPFLETTTFPDSLIVGTDTGNTGQDLQVQGKALIQSTIDQVSYFDTANKLYTMETLQVSSIHMPNMLSSVLIGQTAPPIRPFIDTTGYVVVGENTALPGEQQIWYSRDLSNWLPAETPFTVGTYSKVATNGLGFWVAAGNSTSDSNDTLLWSEDGIRWNKSELALFPQIAYDVVYGFDTSGSGVWVAAGDGTSNLVFSTDGKRWNNASYGTFDRAAFAVAYTNGSFFAVGNNAVSGDFPYLFSVDGRHWSTIVNPAGYTAPFLGTAVGFTDQTAYPDFRIVGGDPGGPPNNTLVSLDGGSTFDYVPVPPLNVRRAFVYATEKWVAAGSNQPSQTGGISVSFDPFAQVWTDVSDGYVNGLTGSYNDLIYDSNRGLFIAAGSMASPTDQVLAISATALSGWSTVSLRYGGSFLSKANGIAVGPIKYPIQKSFTTINVPTTISSVFSTISLQASTIRASSFQGSFFGEGSALSNIEAFASTLILSTMSNTTARTSIISTIENPENRIFTTETNVQNNVFIGNRFELSTNNVWIAGGLDQSPSNILQYGESGRDWSASGTTFQISCKGVSGNGRPLFGETLFIAVGRDSRTIYTIQWSPNGSNWYPIVSGGFSNPLFGIIKTGNNVVFNRYVNAPIGRWVACGEDTGSNTILYSDNGVDWLPANNCFSTTTLKVATLSTMAGYTCYTNVGGRSFFKYSTDGINWFDSAIQTGFDTSVATIGNGMWTRVPQLETYMAFTENGRILQGGGSPTGSSWTFQANYSLPVPSNVIYESPYWATVGRNIIAYTSTPTTNWRSTITTFPQELQFQTITYNRVLNRWAAGGEATSSSNTLWYSDNLRTWTRATSGGFNTRTIASGAGYSVIPYFSNVLAAGTAAYEINTSLQPRILLGDSNGFSLNLTQANAADVFSTQVQAIAYNQNIEGFYTLVAVGDGLTPQKTIARAVSTSSNAFEWLPAITGGFQKAYDVTFFDRTSNNALKKWWAVGDFLGSTNTTAAINAIQASEDGLNWFGSNKAFDSSIYSLQGGGRGIFTFQSSNFPELWNICAVGKGTPQYPPNVVSFTEWWFNNRINGFFGGGGATQIFNVQGNAISALQWSSGYVQIQWLAVGQDTRREYTIQIGDQNSGGGTINSPQAPLWAPITSGGFDIAGHGIVYATLPGFVNMFVAVGEDTDPSKTIQVLVNPDFFGSVFRFSNTGVTGYFTKAGYGVTYNSTVSTFYAVGEDLSGVATRTIKYSKDGFTWSNVDPVQAALNNLFTSEQILGSANALYSQSVLSPEIYPTIEFSNLVFYNNQFQRAYPNPTVRLQSTFMTLQETMTINLNNQVYIASNAPYIDLSNRSTSLTVGGIIVASTIIYTKATGSELTTDTFVKQLIASSITNYKSFTVESFETPSLTIQKQPAAKNTVRTDIATFSINTSTVQSRIVNINNTMFVSADLRQNDFVGIRASTTQIPGPDFIVNGTVAMSSLTSKFFITPSTLQLSTNEQIYFSSAYLKITNNKFRTATDPRNYIYIEPSSMTFNSVLTANISSQKVGLYTENPIFDLDVRRNGVLDSMSTQTLVSRMLFFTLQSL